MRWPARSGKKAEGATETREPTPSSRVEMTGEPMRILAWAGLAAVVIGTIGPVSAQETKLLVTTMSPASSDNVTKFFGPWAERVNQAANGTITLELRNGLTLANH